MDGQQKRAKMKFLVRHEQMHVRALLLRTRTLCTTHFVSNTKNIFSSLPCHLRRHYLMQNISAPRPHFTRMHNFYYSIVFSFQHRCFVPCVCVCVRSMVAMQFNVFILSIPLRMPHETDDSLRFVVSFSSGMPNHL